MDWHVYLDDLDEEHWLFTCPVRGFEYRMLQLNGRWTRWRAVGDSWSIAGKSFNELGPSWKLRKQWRVPHDRAWEEYEKWAGLKQTNSGSVQ